ncbi:unnamed protein product, partial [Rotaria sordida]
CNLVVVYTWSFAAATPSFRCKLHENDKIYDTNTLILFNQSQPDETYCKTHMKISVQECQRCYMKTKSNTDIIEIQPCKNYVFDRTYYDYTLVEEWLMICDRTVFRSAVQNVFFIGYMIGSIVFGIMADNLLPESTRWLLVKGQYQQVEKLLRKIAKTNKRTFDKEAFQRMKTEQEKNTTNTAQKTGILSLFQSKVICIISINLFFQWFVQNLVYYGVSQNTGSWGFDPYLSFTMSACVEILAIMVLHLILNRIGRKIPYFTAGFCFSIIALLTIPVRNSPNQKILIFIMNVMLKFFASASYGIIYIYSNELFPTHLRSTGMGLCSMIARIGAILGTTSNDMLARLWINLPTVLYGIVSLVGALVVLMLPETLNKPLPQTIEDTEQMGLVW